MFLGIWNQTMRQLAGHALSMAILYMNKPSWEAAQWAAMTVTEEELKTEEVEEVEEVEEAEVLVEDEESGETFENAL